MTGHGTRQAGLIVSRPESESAESLESCMNLLVTGSSGAIFDRSRKYRYLLWRRWDFQAPVVCFIMLNPSTADAHQLDPTITRCLKFAELWKFGGLEIVNLFSYRATDRKRLTVVRDPVGRYNDAFVLNSAGRASRIVLAWGNDGKLHNRNADLLELLSCDHRLHHFGLTRQGEPRHPLYLKRESALQSLIADHHGPFNSFCKQDSNPSL